MNDHKSRREGFSKDNNEQDAFKKSKNWWSFDLKLQEHMQRQRGDQLISLVYLMRKHGVLSQGTVYQDQEKERINTVPLTGESFDIENNKFFLILKTLTLDGPGWTHIKSFERMKNGRGAYLKLQSTYMGGSHRLTIVADAESSIGTLDYTGSKNFTFDKFLAKLIGAYNDIKKYSSQVTPDSSKVTQIINKISCPTMATVKTIIMADPRLQNNFDEAKNLFIAQHTVVKRNDLLTCRRAVSLAGRGSGGGFGRNGNRGGDRGGVRYSRGNHNYSYSSIH